MSEMNLMLFVDAPQATLRQLDQIAHGLDQQAWHVSKHAGWFAKRVDCRIAELQALSDCDLSLTRIMNALGVSDWDAVCLVSDTLEPITRGNSCALPGSRLSDLQLSEQHM